MSRAVFLLHSAQVAPPTQAFLHPDYRSLCWAGGKAAERHLRVNCWKRCGYLQFDCRNSQCDGTAKVDAGRSPTLSEFVPLRKLHGGRKWWPEKGTLKMFAKVYPRSTLNKSRCDSGKAVTKEWYIYTNLMCIIGWRNCWPAFQGYFIWFSIPRSCFYMKCIYSCKKYILILHIKVKCMAQQGFAFLLKKYEW